MEEEKIDFKHREKQLLNLIVEQNQKDDPNCQSIMYYQDMIYRKAEQLAKLEQKVGKL